MYVSHIKVSRRLDTDCASQFWFSIAQEISTNIVKCKAIPLQAWTFPDGSRRLRLPDFKTVGTWSGNVVSHTHRPPLSPTKYSWYSFLLEAESTPGPQSGRKYYVSDHHRESNPRPTNIDKPIKNGLFLESGITYNDSLSHWLPIYDTNVRYSYLSECLLCKLVASLVVVRQQ